MIDTFNEAADLLLKVSHARDLLTLRQTESMVGLQPAGVALDSLRGSLAETRHRGSVRELFLTLSADQDLLLRQQTATRLQRTPAWRPSSATTTLAPGVGFGTYRLTSEAALMAAIEGGACLIDTAETYGYGRVEDLVGSTIRKLGNPSLPLASKVSRSHMSASASARAIERSVTKLGQPLLLAQTHWPSASLPVAETAEGFAKAWSAGMFKAVGLSNVSVDQLCAFRAALPSEVPLAAVQTLWNPSNPEAEWALVPFAREVGLAVIAYSPFCQDVRALASLSGHSPQSSLRWLLNRGAIPIPQTNKPAHVFANLGSL